VALLAADVVVYTDGGGRGPTLPRPLSGRDRVTRLFGHYRPEALGAVARRSATVNGQPGAVFFDAGSRAVLVIALDVAGGRVLAVRTITNPAKLRHLDERPGRGRRDPAEQFGKLEPMEAAVPNLRRIVLLPNCGHWTQQERPRDVNGELLDVLRMEGW
jgi:RNA polymerase sigma-70 factor (ECF subfamily)